MQPCAKRGLMYHYAIGKVGADQVIATPRDTNGVRGGDEAGDTFDAFVVYPPGTPIGYATRRQDPGGR